MSKLCEHLTQSLTLEPLEQALDDRIPEIHHSDQGVQYLSNAYLSTLKAHGIQISVARRGCPWENGYAERLIRTLKEEEVYLNDYQDITEARVDANNEDAVSRRCRFHSESYNV